MKRDVMRKSNPTQVYRGAKTGPRPVPYNTKKKETRGQYKREARICGLFWKYHTMDDIITLTPEELDIKIEQFYDEYQARQTKINRNWWYPEWPHERTVDLRKAK
jgi:hypothetical protein